MNVLKIRACLPSTSVSLCCTLSYISAEGSKVPGEQSREECETAEGQERSDIYYRQHLYVGKVKELGIIRRIMLAEESELAESQAKERRICKERSEAVTGGVLIWMKDERKSECVMLAGKSGSW